MNKAQLRNRIKEAEELIKSFGGDIGKLSPEKLKEFVFQAIGKKDETSI